MRNVTIRDVARAASVSVASVSRVLNGQDNVRAELRERIEAASAALGYVPHAGARSLSLARSGAIGVMLPDVFGEFFSEMIRGMDREASGRGLQLLLANAHADPLRAAEALRTMRGRVDGLVVMAPDIDPLDLKRHLPPSVPTVLVNCADNDLGHGEFRVDNRTAARTMVDHLIALGHRRIIHLSGPAGNIEASARTDGYLAAMTAADFDPQIIEGEFTEESGIHAAQMLLQDADAIDAVFAANDMMAIGLMTTFRRNGIKVPHDVAIAGYDDIPLARLVSPSLTTMRIDIAKVGARAIAQLADRIAGMKVPAPEHVIPRLIIRETTKRPR